MIGFFPAPYPDELLYSILARYYLKSPNDSPKAALDELFGSTTITATFDLPSHLESLVSNLPLGSTHTTKSFIENNTLYPLYEPFLPPERALEILNSMQAHFHGDIHTRAGIMAGTIPAPKYLRFCPICAHEEIEKYGETQWHRLHQVTGVLVCPTHLIWLQDSKVKIVEDNRHQFYAADKTNCTPMPATVKYTRETFNKLILLAQDVESLLNLSLPSKTGQWYRNTYQGLLIDKGVATASGRVRQRELIQEFTEFYGEEFLKAVHSEIQNNNESNWLSSIVRKHRKTFQIRDADPPIRVTKRSIGKQMNLIPFTSQNLNKLPSTKAVLLNYVESTRDFQIRRIKRIVHKNLKLGRPNKLWDIIEDACIGTPYIKNLIDSIHEIISFAETEHLTKQVS